MVLTPAQGTSMVLLDGQVPAYVVTAAGADERLARGQPQFYRALLAHALLAGDAAELAL